MTSSDFGRADTRELPISDAHSRERVPIYFIWHPAVGPLLSLGMLAASARHRHEGALTRSFEIRRPETAESMLDDLHSRRGPAILVCSDYVFTLDANLAAARTAKAHNRSLFVIHGGPSAPARIADAEQFLTDHGDVADVLVRGEGEEALCEILGAVADRNALCSDALTGIAGLTFTTADGRFVRTPDRPRIADPDALPSPYLTGEFDDIPVAAWVEPPFFESNRGCPYGCTFCDWGSSTNSRVRTFAIERVLGEIEWALTRGVRQVMLCDANFGLLRRDVDIARGIAELRTRLGSPDIVMFTPSKSRWRHLRDVLDVFFDAGITPLASISLQTTDPSVLEAVDRQNVSIDSYLSLAAALRRRGHALVGDLIMGLPGQTTASYRNDLQFMLDHEIMPRTFPLRLLPNAPMNDPAYRSRWGISSVPGDLVEETATLSTSDWERMRALQRAEIIFERLGLLRHVMRLVQWDYGILATELMERVIDLSADGNIRYPNLTWVVRHFERTGRPAAGWKHFYEDVREFLLNDLGVPASDSVDTVLCLQEFLMPAPRRRYPSDLALNHDYLAYYGSAARRLYQDGHAGRPDRPLRSYPPTRFSVHSDPLGVGDRGLDFNSQTGREAHLEGDFHVGATSANELESPLLRRLPALAGYRSAAVERFVTSLLGDDWSDPDVAPTPTPVALGRSGPSESFAPFSRTVRPPPAQDHS